MFTVHIPECKIGKWIFSAISGWLQVSVPSGGVQGALAMMGHVLFRYATIHVQYKAREVWVLDQGAASICKGFPGISSSN